jgi:hypothetical protein
MTSRPLALPWSHGKRRILFTTRVVLVKEAGDLPAVAPDLPPEGLTRKGFPGPVWVVVVWARCDRAPRSQKLEYIFEASTGAEIIRSGLSCDLPQPFPTLGGPPLPGEADQHTELERRLVETRVTFCNGGCRQYRRRLQARGRTGLRGHLWVGEPPGRQERAELPGRLPRTTL